MVTGCIMKPPVMMEWIPSGIILGLRMGVAEENLVVSMAKEAGIKNIYSLHIIEGFRAILEVTLVSFSVLNLR